MKMIVGLGNPGLKYDNTRHNVGFAIVDMIARRGGAGFSFKGRFRAEVAEVPGMMLVKPQTFMNKSGLSVSRLLNFYKIEHDDLYIVHDDLDLRMGKYKIQQNVGPRNHRGILSIEHELGSSEFWRIRIGVDSRSAENRIVGEEYVLMPLSEDEKVQIEELVSRVVDDLMRRFGLR